MSPAAASADPAGWLALAAAPTFAVMALATGDGMPAICATGPSFLPVGGMTAMYLLMTVFHLSPWLRLASARR